MFTKAEQNKLLKIKRILEDVFDNGNLKKYNLVPYSAEELVHSYNSIVRDITHSTVTIFIDVKNIFEKRGFYVKEEGIGWKIYLRK